MHVNLNKPEARPISSPQVELSVANVPSTVEFTLTATLLPSICVVRVATAVVPEMTSFKSMQ
jgi:hypothetical protein